MSGSSNGKSQIKINQDYEDSNGQKKLEPPLLLLIHRINAVSLSLQNLFGNLRNLAQVASTAHELSAKRACCPNRALWIQCLYAILCDQRT
jgi:hypothetical protein